MGSIDQAKRSERMQAILAYCQTFAGQAPVTADSIHRFLVHHAGFDETDKSQTDVDLTWLVSDGNLKRDKAWIDGRWQQTYEITAKGIDRANGALPPAGTTH